MKGWDACPPVQPLSLENGGLPCSDMTAPGQAMLGSTRAGGGREVVAVAWPWAQGRKGPWGGGSGLVLGLSSSAPQLQDAPGDMDCKLELQN